MTTSQRVIGVSVLVAALSAATPAHTQTVAPGPYYATPSWAQKLPAATRFVVLSNWNSEAVLDRETGLVWQRTPFDDERILWEGLIHCSDATTGGRAGWRLPSLHELGSLIDPSVNGNDVVSLPVGHPFVGITTAHFLTATSLSSDQSSAFVRSLEVASFVGTAVVSKGENHRIWCVRGGGPIGVQ